MKKDLQKDTQSTQHKINKAEGGGYTARKKGSIFMKELKKYYDVKLSEFETLHKKYVQSNKNLNALHLAKRQIQTEGDTKIDYAGEVLDKAIKEEKHKNDTLTYEVNALAGFLLDMECYIRDTFGEKLNGVYNVRGY